MWSNAFIVGILSKMMKSWSIVVANTAVIDLGCPWIEADVKTILTQKCLFILKLGVNGRDVWYFVEHKDLFKGKDVHTSLSTILSRSKLCRWQVAFSLCPDSNNDRPLAVYWPENPNFY